MQEEGIPPLSDQEASAAETSRPPNDSALSRHGTEREGRMPQALAAEEEMRSARLASVGDGPAVAMGAESDGQASTAMFGLPRLFTAGQSLDGTPEPPNTATPTTPPSEIGEVARVSKPPSEPD